jgi:hypothetical protein
MGLLAISAWFVLSLWREETPPDMKVKGKAIVENIVTYRPLC